MNKLLDIEKTVFEQLKDNETSIKDTCTFAQVKRKSIDNWKAKDPKSITDFKRIANVVQLIEDLSKLDVSVELKQNSLILSTGGWQEFTDEPFNKQIKDICKAQIEKSNADDYIGLLVKIIKVCR